MYLIAIGWLYVALMMSIAEATNTNGSVIGAVFTFLMYGLGPTALVMYILGTPSRRQRRREQEAREEAAAAAAAAAASADAPGTASVQPDAGGQTTADPVPPVRKEP